MPYQLVTATDALMNHSAFIYRTKQSNEILSSQNTAIHNNTVPTQLGY